MGVFVGTWEAGDTSKELRYILKDRATGNAIDLTSASGCVLRYKIRGKDASETAVTAAKTGTPTDGSLGVYIGNEAGAQGHTIDFRFEATIGGKLYYAPDDGWDSLRVTTFP
jgi:hypothetical protein